MSSAVRVRFLLSAVILVSCSDVARAAGRWTNLGPGGGGTVYGVAFDPKSPLTLYAGTSAGVFKSIDRGASWSPARDGLTQPLVRSLVLDPKASAKLYAATPAGIFRTENGGLSWSFASAGIPDATVTQLAVGATAQGTALYAVVFSNGIYRSVDGALSWSRIQGLPSDSIYAFAIDPADGKTLYAAITLSGRTDGGLYKSEDGGETWSLKGLGLEKVELGTLLVDPSSPNVVYAGAGATTGTNDDLGVYKSEDGGATWSQRNTGLFSGSYISSFAIDSLSSARIFAVTNSGNFRSDDAAASWNQLLVVPGEPFPFGSIFVAADPLTSDLYSGGSTGLYRTSDRGVHWAALDRGMEAYAVVSLVRDPAAASTLYAGACLPKYTEDQRELDFYPCDVFLLKTTDSGESWTRVPLPGPGHRDHVSRSISLALLPMAPGTVLATTPAGVFKSTDAGGTFTALSFTRPAWRIAVDPTSTRVFYVASDDGLYKTADSGANWTRLATGAQEISTVALAPSDPSVVYAGVSRGVLRSRDAGSTWSSTGSLAYATTISAIAVSPTSSSVVLAGGEDVAFGGLEGTLYQTTDGGDRWDPTLLEVISAVVVDPIAPNHVCAGGYGIFQSFDGGRTWSEVDPRPPVVFSLALDPTRGGTAYGGSADGVFEISTLPRVNRRGPVRTVAVR